MKKIGKYEIRGEIGRGGMGVVYKAYDPYLDEIVAVKTMSSEYASEESFRKKFFEEGKKTRRLKHENIIEVFDLDEDEGLPYLAMEFLEGRDLNDEIVSHKLVSLEQKLRIMKEVCAGLSHAHQKGIIHLDIKPGNIFITANGQAKILDFGLARAATSVSMSTKLMGTPHYMPPEQWDRKVDERTDVFAATAVFYELLTHRKAFDGEGWGEIYYQIRNIDPPSPEQINPEIPSELSQIVMRSLAKDPAQRHQRMEEFQQALEKFETTLEEQKRALLAEALAAIGNLNQLITQNIDLLPKDSEQTSDSVTVEQPASEYFALLQLCHRTRREHKLTEALIEKRRHALPIIEKATVLEGSGDLEQAAALLDGVLQDDPRNLKVVSLRNNLLSRIERKKLAEETEIHVRDLLQEAAAQFSSDLTKSHALLEEVLGLRPGHEAAAALQKKIRQKLQEQAELEEKNRQLEEILASARKALGSGNFKQAREIVDRASQLHGPAAGIAEILEAIEREERIDRDLREKERTASAIRVEAELAQIQAGLTEAHKLLSSEEFDAARAQLLNVLSLSHDNPLAREMLEKIDQLQEERNKREKIAALLVQSRLALSEQNYDEAGRRAREVLRLDPQNDEAASLRAGIDRALEQRIKRAKFRTALRLGAALLAVGLVIAAGVRMTSLSADLSGKAAALLNEGKYEDAQRVLNQWVLLGQARELKENLIRVQEAHKAFEPAISRSDYKAASGAFDQIRTINPSDPALPRYQEELDKTFATDFSDEFASLKKWDAPATWSVDPAKKMLLVRGPGIGLVADKSWSDSKVVFGLKFVNRKGAVWILRARNRDDHYMFQITSTGVFKSFSCRGGEIQELKSRTIPKNLSNPDDYFQIIIEATEDSITHSLQTMLEPEERAIKIDILTDRSHRAGSFGFGTRDGEEFNVTDFLVQPIPQKAKPASN